MKNMKETCSKSKENVINRKNEFFLCWIWNLFPLSKYKKILSPFRNKFHIQRQNIEYPLNRHGVLDLVLDSDNLFAHF